MLVTQFVKMKTWLYNNIFNRFRIFKCVDSSQKTYCQYCIPAKQFLRLPFILTLFFKLI